MFRPAFTLAGILLATATAFTAPVPKGIKAKKLHLALPRPLMIHTATVEEGVMKLICGEDDREPRTALLRDVTATDCTGKKIDSPALTERLKKPTAVIVVPCPLPKRVGTSLGGERDLRGERDAEPVEVDTGDEWRKTLSPATIVIDGAVFDLNWEYGRYDLQIAPAEVKDGEVAVAALGVPLQWRTDRWAVEGNLIPRGNDQNAAEEFATDITTHGVVIYHRTKELPKEHKELFRNDVPFAHDDGAKHLKPVRIHGSIL